MTIIESTIILIKKYGFVFLAVVIILTPVTWKVAASYFSERLETLSAQVSLLKEQVLVLKEQKKALEEKLRQPVYLDKFPEYDSKKPSALAPSSQSSSVKKFLRLPDIADSARLTKEEIRELARFYGLFKHWKVNPHLRFKEGDISYWSEQGLTEEELMTEFESRQTVLSRAEKSGEKIYTQSDLSYKALQLQVITR